VLGIIGHNGAGKSTLAEAAGRMSQPTSGRIAIRGGIAPLIEVSAGFVGSLTGRENVYLNGAILGMTKKEIDRKFDEIVDFADGGVHRHARQALQLGYACEAGLSVATSIGRDPDRRRSLGRRRPGIPAKVLRKDGSTDSP
jgi:ABC-type polysaccharide/polyol phosphate transport system ATPase subunit